MDIDFQTALEENKEAEYINQFYKQITRLHVTASMPNV
jgi:hypothetical protein